MKKVLLGVLVLVATLQFTSCSDDASEVILEQLEFETANRGRRQPLIQRHSNGTCTQAGAYIECPVKVEEQE
mgnify:CR=1 FL=1